MTTSHYSKSAQPSGLQVALICRVGSVSYFLPMLWFVSAVDDAKDVLTRLKELLLPASVGPLQVGEERVAQQFNFEDADLRGVFHNAKGGRPVVLVLHSSSHSTKAFIPLWQHVLKTTEEIDDFVSDLYLALNCKYAGQEGQHPSVESYCIKIKVRLDYNPGEPGEPWED